MSKPNPREDTYEKRTNVQRTGPDCGAEGEGCAQSMPWSGWLVLGSWEEWE